MLIKTNYTVPCTHKKPITRDKGKKTTTHMPPKDAGFGEFACTSDD